MSKDHEYDTAPRKKKGATVIVWILMAMLILSLGGFGVTNFGTGITSIGSVGDREIDVNRYSRTLQQELAALGAQTGQNVTLEQARQFGLDRQVLQSLIATVAVENEADRIGISVGDARVAEELRGMQTFRGLDGTFDREAYRFVLERNNLSEAEFEQGLRDDLARSLLQGAVVGGFPAPHVLTDTLYAYVAERRGYSLLRLTEADLTDPLPEASDELLKAHYDANIAVFTRPEARRITYAALLPETLATTMAPDEAALRAAYDQRRAEFVQPERRLVERLVYPTAEEAAAAKARADAGEGFEALVAARGLKLDDVDLGDVSREDLGAAAETVFALTEPGIAGPVDTDLGPALFRVNAILSAQETTFEEAREQLAAELQQDAARRAIADQREAIDDALAGGATLEDIGREFAMTVATFDYVPGSEEPVAGYPAFREAAEAAAEGDYPEIFELDDGGLATLRLDAIVPPAPIPFEEARDRVAEHWTASETAKALAGRAATIRAEVEAGASLGAYGIVSVAAELARQGFVEDAPPGFVDTVFGMAEGEVRVIEGPGFTGVVRLDTITPAPAEGDEAEALKAAIAAQAEQALAQDGYALFTTALSDGAGITLNDAAINAVHAQFQ